MTVAERREALLAWLKVWGPCDTGRCATYARRQQVEFLYVGHGSRDRCSRDLKALERANAIRRIPGRPVRWRAV